MTTLKRKILIVVDPQNGFCEGGELASTGAAQTCQKIAQYLSEHSREYVTVILSKDWHIAPGDHFKTWPVHCVAGTRSAEFFWPIQDWLDSAKAADVQARHLVSEVRKGQYSDGYSAWEARSAVNAASTEEIIRSAVSYSRAGLGGIALTIDVCGLVTEHCVKATVLDALQMKWFGADNKPLTVRLLEDLTTAHDSRDASEALAIMASRGAVISHS